MDVPDEVAERRLFRCVVSINKRNDSGFIMINSVIYRGVKDGGRMWLLFL